MRRAQMRLEDYEPYRDVVYTPYKGCDKSKIEYGVTTNANNNFIFVRFNFAKCSIACPAHTLEYYDKEKDSKATVIIEKLKLKIRE
jgi:hypothetical protein